MKNNKKQGMNTKRTIAVVIAVILFIGASLSSGLFNLLNKKIESKTEGVNKVFNKMAKDDMTERVISGSNPSEKILVINIDGVIADRGGMASTYNHQGTLRLLNSVKKDPSIKGIILRVNSPGGGVYESAELRDKILDIKDEMEIPFYTSMGGTAASGGYYIAAPTDRIYASEETMTGSIGVIMQSLNMSKLMEKVGIEDNTIKSSKFKDIGSSYREMTEEDRKVLQDMIDSSYDRFVKVVAEGRGMDEARVREIADGRIYDGAQALEVDLIDEIGYFEKVVMDMTKDLGLSNPQVVEMDMDDMNYIRSIIGIRSEEKMGNSELMVLERFMENYDLNNTPKLMYIHGGN